MGRSITERRAIDSFWAGDYRSAVAYYDAVLAILERDPEPPERDLRTARIEVSRAAALRRSGATAAARAADAGGPDRGIGF